MKFEGVMPALITPVTEDGKLNVGELKKLIENLIAQGADGFYIGGATGEGLILDKELHKELTRESIRIVDHRVPCIVHVARTVYPEMIELAKYAEEVGADAISAIPPIFYRYTDNEIFAYYEKLASSVNIPVVIYNNPNTGVAFSENLLERLFTIKNLTAIKWTTYDFATVLELKRRVPEANVINGPDEMALMGFSAGCDACIGTTYNFQLPLVKNMYNAFKAGKIDEARKYQTQITHAAKIICSMPAITATKYILALQGFDVYHTVFPTAKLTAEQEARLDAEFKNTETKF